MISILYLLLCTLISANSDRYQLGIINHYVQWHMHCPENQTRIINPTLHDQPLITYECPFDSLPVDIVPIEIDFTFICRPSSRLIWMIIDLYQYNDRLWSTHREQFHIDIELNQQIRLNQSKTEISNYKNRFIIIHAFYIPFEHLNPIFNQTIQASIRVNDCQFSLTDNLTWTQIIHEQCQAKTLNVQHAKCDFYPKFERQTNEEKENTTTIPDFHVVLQIDQETTIPMTTLPSYVLSFDAHYKQILSTLNIIVRTSSLLTYIFIFTLISLVLLVIFFLYILCYHYHMRTKRKSSLLI